MQLIDRHTLADRWGVDPSTIWRWSKKHADFPKPVNLGPNCTRFKLADVEAWEASQQQKPTAPLVGAAYR